MKKDFLILVISLLLFVLVLGSKIGVPKEMNFSCRSECCAYVTLTDPKGDIRVSGKIMNCLENCTSCKYPFPCDKPGWWNSSINYTYNFGDEPSEINKESYCCTEPCPSTTTTTVLTTTTTTTITISTTGVHEEKNYNKIKTGKEPFNPWVWLLLMLLLVILALLYSLKEN